MSALTSNDTSHITRLCSLARAWIIRGLCCMGMGLLLSGCTGGSKQALDIGPHRGSFRLPAGWAVVHQGEKWEVRKGEASIVLHDLGPVSPASLQQEASRLAALWRGGHPEAAQTRLRRLLNNVQRMVAEPGRRPLVSAILPLMETAARTLPEAELTERLTDLQAAIGALPPHDLDALGEAALQIAGHDRRRDIRSRARISVGGRSALDFMTVTRSTQAFKKRIVVIDNNGYLLAIYFGVLGHEAHLGQFDQVVRTLHFDAAASERR